MSKKTDYSAEEWKAISGAPVAAGLLITLADASDPVGIAKQALAVGKALARSSTSGNAPEIVKSIAENVKSAGGRPDLLDVLTGDRAQTNDVLIGAIKTAVRAVECKSPGEAEAYKAWLASIAAAASRASKEAGFLGLAGPMVSNDEEEAIQRLADALRVRTRRTNAVRT
jgi:hypothetical protein